MIGEEWSVVRAKEPYNAIEFDLVHESGTYLIGPIILSRIDGDWHERYNFPKDIAGHPFRVGGRLSPSIILASFPEAIIHGEWVFFGDTDMALIRLSA